eukprot:TRINITY_DN1220_c0_g1_i19.p1 TRINITY_DN1220_c0_g1~~TRINITY_DN1220_c0_g1_i19.p1  ORF type:complete len:516 (+),score=69.59 TRINITY_DN1220_c0_g1_i19:66-1613(+)
MCIRDRVVAELERQLRGRDDDINTLKSENSKVKRELKESEDAIANYRKIVEMKEGGDNDKVAVEVKDPRVEELVNEIKQLRGQNMEKSDKIASYTQKVLGLEREILMKDDLIEKIKFIEDKNRTLEEKLRQYEDFQPFARHSHKVSIGQKFGDISVIEEMKDIEQNRMSFRFPSIFNREKLSMIKPLNEIDDNFIEEMRATLNAPSDNPENALTPGSATKTISIPKAAIEYKKNMFSEDAISAYDYLGLRENQQIIKMLRKYGELKDDGGDLSVALKVFSDFMYRINHREHKELRVLFITSQALYNLHPKKDYEVVRRIDLKKIHRVSLFETSPSLCAIHVEEEYDYLVQTYRRQNMLIFLKEMFERRGLNQFLVVSSTDFSIKNRNATKSKNIKDYDQSSMLNKDLQESYKRAIYMGLLEIEISSVMSVKWQEYFFVLSNVGLLYFDEPEQTKPAGFIPLGYSVDQNFQRTDKPYAFKIITGESKNDKGVILAAKSYADKQEWIKALKSTTANK